VGGIDGTGFDISGVEVSGSLPRLGD